LAGVRIKVISFASVVALASAAAAHPRIPLAERVVVRLEHRFPRASVGDGRDFLGVVALGGRPDRVREAGRLAQQFPHLLVIVSGAGTRPEVLPMLGGQIDPHRVLVDETALTTYENALFSARIINKFGRSRWLLVTSASHMPRAIGAFRHQGIDVNAWPIFDPIESPLTIKRVAWHEVLGLVAYWMLRRTSELLPNPTR
jgi:uncharacterized SAM-binding protein YcdF (DUF218 family)